MSRLNILTFFYVTVEHFSDKVCIQFVFVILYKMFSKVMTVFNSLRMF